MKKQTNELSEKWIKASIVGTIWAASEIVLGSFLHNLKIPFSGNLLTGIAIVILISVSYIWKERGLFWRAGLICAVMKTISPSAVIFGPMIAIFSEALLLEFSVRIFGRTFFGYILGGMLAMSWNLSQKIFNFLIFYGFGIVELYTNLIAMAQKQLQLQTDLLWLPLFVLLSIYCLLGAFSAILGIRAGHRLIRQPVSPDVPPIVASQNNKTQVRDSEFSYSLIWLFSDVAIILAALAILSFAPVPVWILFVSFAVSIWAIRYKRALRQLSKPKFWFFFVSITMLTAFVFSSVQEQSWQEALLIGLQMNFRAVVMIVGFSVLGTELYNPRIRTFFLKTSFKQLPAALELSFESLPTIIAYFPDFKTFVRNPVSVVYRVVSQVENRLNEIRSSLKSSPKVILLTGPVGFGKTTFVKHVARMLNEQGIRCGGVYSERILGNNLTSGYDVVDIRTENSAMLLVQIPDYTKPMIGRFAIIPEGFEFGHDILVKAMAVHTEVIVVDEFGKLELRHEGWARSFEELLQSETKIILLAVRKGYENDVVANWQLTHYEIHQIENTRAEEFAQKIIRYFTT